MKKLLALSLTIIVAVSALVLGSGCATTPGAPINLATSALLSGSFNLGTWNPALVVEAASQCPQVGSIDASGMGVSFHWARNAPPGYVAQPIVPLTPDRIALIRGDALGSQVLAMSNDKASDDVTLS